MKTIAAILLCTLLGLILPAPPAHAQSSGLFTVTDITVADQVINKTYTYTGCIVDTIDEHYASGTPINKAVAQCDTRTVTTGSAAPPHAGGIIPYYTITINGDSFTFWIWVCNVVIDDTDYIPGVGGPTGTRPYNYRKIMFRCYDGS